MRVLKGFTCNDPVEEHVMSLHADVATMGWHPVLWDTSKRYGRMKWYIITWNQYAEFSRENIEKAKAHPCYGGDWLILNEPDLGNPWTAPADAAATVIEMGNFILSADPIARIIVPCGTWLHPLYEKDSWFQQFWKNIPRGNLKRHIGAFFTHYYHWNTTLELEEYLKLCRDYMLVEFPFRKLLLSEVGVTWSSSEKIKAKMTPTKIFEALEKYADVFQAGIYYSMSKNDGYETLQVPDGSGKLTERGVEFAAL